MLLNAHRAVSSSPLAARMWLPRTIIAAVHNYAIVLDCCYSAPLLPKRGVHLF